MACWVYGLEDLIIDLTNRVSSQEGRHSGSVELNSLSPAHQLIPGTT